MNHRISVCITTCNRLHLLREAIDSCLTQSLLPNEIVVGDDSTSDETALYVQGLAGGVSVPIVYKRNVPRLGQNENVNSVFQRASGTHLLLLHDDDLLLPTALRDLISCWEEHCDLIAAYGKQYVITHDGICDLDASEALNEEYYRAAQHAGLQNHPWMVGLVQQFPNDCYLIVADAAKQTGWRSFAEVGYGGEFDFGLRLGMNYKNFYFKDVYTAKYRLTNGISISSSSSDDAALQSYRILRSASLPSEAEAFRARRLAVLAPRAIRQAAERRQRKQAWEIYWSENYPWRKRVSFGGIRNILRLLLRP